MSTSDQDLTSQIDALKKHGCGKDHIFVDKASGARYGPDAYGFAKDKPLVLMGGANLLHLLEKHGHRAKIDIKQAREQLDEQ